MKASMRQRAAATAQAVLIQSKLMTTLCQVVNRNWWKVQSVSQVEHFIRNKEERMNLPFRDLDHVVHLLKVLRLQSDSTDGEDKTRGQPEDQVDQANDQSPHLQFVTLLMMVILKVILKEVTLRGQQQQKCEKTGHLHIVNSLSLSQELDSTRPPRSVAQEQLALYLLDTIWICTGK